MKWESTGYLVLSALNVKDGYIDKAVDAKCGNQALFERWMGFERLEKGDVIFTTEAPLGNVAQIPDDDGYILNQRAVGFKTNPDNLNNNFLAQLLRTPLFQNKLQANASGGTAKGIGTKEFAKLDVTIPLEIDEQKRVGNFFNLIDDTIALHLCKQHQLEALKQSLIKDILPQNDSVIPRLRFAGFSDSWEQRKLGDLAESFEYGLNASATIYDGENKYIRITDIDESSHLFLQKNLTSPDTDLSNANNYLLETGDLLFARTGASVGKSYQYNISDGKVYFAGFLIRARIRPEVNSNFIFQNTFTSNYQNFIKITSQRSGQPGVNAQEYATFDLVIPSKKEQDQLGSYFEQLDKTIKLQQCKLEKLIELKHVLLGKMFL